MKTVSAILLCGAASLGSIARGHNSFAVVSTRDNGSALELAVPTATLDPFSESGRLLGDSESPGFGVNLPATRPPAGTVIGLEVLGGLVYWDGQSLTPTEAVLEIEAPFVGTNDLYEVTHNTAGLAGMTWGVYPGVADNEFWELHGAYTLSDPTGSLATGLYGVPVRIIDGRPDSPLGPSEPRLFPLLFDPNSSWPHSDQEGRAALSMALFPTPGDFDRNGAVDQEDYGQWVDEFGSPIAPGGGADANADGLVDAADYTVWRDTLAAAASSTAIPEPGSAILAMTLLAFLSPPQRATPAHKRDSNED